MLIHPGSRLVSAGIAALAIGFALGLRAVPAGVSVSETIQPKNFDPWGYFGSEIPNSRGLRVASLEPGGVFGAATADSEESTDSEETVQSISPGASFDERFAGAVDWPSSRTTVGTEEGTNIIPPAPDPGGPAATRRAVSQSARAFTSVPKSPPAGAPKKQLRVAEATEDLSSPPDEDRHTAIYDISAHKVYLPNGQTLEAHSGYGSHLDDPRYVSEKDRGPTPPNVYDLSLREEMFHGVRAIRLNPVGGGNMFGREGLLAHSYMLGPNGQSNGCVSFSDYSAFLSAYQSGEINRLVVVEHLATPPSPQTAWGGIAATIKALFGRS